MEDQKARCGNHQSVENPGMSCIIQGPQSLIAFFFYLTEYVFLPNIDSNYESLWLKTMEANLYISAKSKMSFDFVVKVCTKLFYRMSQQVLDRDLSKNLSKTRESLFTFWLGSADLNSI